MVAPIYSWMWGRLVLLLPIILCTTLTEGCIIPKEFPHSISADMNESGSQMCYTCYQAPTADGFKVNLNKLRLNGIGSVMVYLDSKQKLIEEDCGGCDTFGNLEGTNEGEAGETECHECVTLPSGSMFELYVRLSPQYQGLTEGESVCQNIPNLNISLTIDSKLPDLEAPSDCEDGFWVSFPLSGDTCAVGSTSLDRETLCIVASCTDSILSPDTSNEKIEHKFQPESPTETCIWELNTEQRKHMTLRFSQNVRPHITVYEDSLLNPKWDVEWCPTFGNEYSLQTEADTVFIVYHNTQKLTKKGSLSITTQVDLCLLPPAVKNGSVNFKRQESGTVALYSCDKGFSLLGPSEIRCKNRSWEEPPVCISHHKDKLMSDAPMGSIEISDSVNGSSLTSENGTFLISAPDSEPHGKMPGVMFPEQDLKNDEEEKETDTKDLYEDYDTDVHHEMLTNHSLGEVDEYETEISNLLPIVNSTEAQEEENQLGIFTGLLDISLEDDLTMYIIIGAAGLLLFIIIVITSIVVYRKRYPVRLGLGRKFDTFQNPIYEKTVVRMPMQVEETEVGRKKSDAEEMSDCTVLE